MHIEIKKEGKRRKFYLTQSFRSAGKVKKARIYLGTNLAGAKLSSLRKGAEPLLASKIRAKLSIRSPFETVLSKSELDELKALEAKAKIKITHLSENEWQKFTEAFTFSTNAIEGSSISPHEVVDILGRGKWPDKPKGDISETYGVAKAIDFTRKTREHVSIPLILKLHKIVFENSKPFAGKLRSVGVEVVVADGRGNIVHRGAPSPQIRGLLIELAHWYSKNRKKYSPIVLAAVVHNQFENIHPFQDGNGRVGRILLNNILLRHNMPPINIELRNQREYYAALQAYEKEYNLRPTMELMLREYRGLRQMLKKR